MLVKFASCDRVKQLAVGVLEAILSSGHIDPLTQLVLGLTRRHLGRRSGRFSLLSSRAGTADLARWRAEGEVTPPAPRPLGVLSVRESRSAATPFSTGSSAIDPNLLVAKTGAGAGRAEALLCRRRAFALDDFAAACA